MKESAGLLLYRSGPDGLEVLIAHPGGPFWAKRDHGVWSIPKGERDDPAEDLADLARREFAEETGHPAPARLMPLGAVTQKAGKVIHGFAAAGDLDPAAVESNTFEMEWPPRSGRRRSFPEIDRVAWCPPDEARRKLNPAQAAFVDRLVAILEG